MPIFGLINIRSNAHFYVGVLIDDQFQDFFVACFVRDLQKYK